MSAEGVTLEDVRRSAQVLAMAGAQLLAAPLEGALRALPGGREAIAHLVDARVSFLKAIRSVIDSEISYLEKLKSERLVKPEVKREKVEVE